MDKAVSYKIKNWSQYNRSLIKRGNLTLWFDEESLSCWYAVQPEKPKRGRSKTYSNQAIELCLTLKNLFSFPLRATQGFVQGLLSLLGHGDIDVPCYTQMSRRAANLNISFYSKKSAKKPMDLVIDSTGLKIYGEGEWKMRTHGKQKRRTWRKLHLAVNPDSFEIVSMELTEATIHDDQMMAPLLENQKNIGNVYGDGAYISKSCFDAIAGSGGTPFIPLRSGTTLSKKNPSQGQKLRNHLLKNIWRSGGRPLWKQLSGYHRRSLVETQMYRLKTILGDRLSSRLMKNQVTEAKIKALILNKMTKLGMPISVRV